MVSQVDMCNRALSALGARSGSTNTTSAISSLTQANSNTASQCNLLYESTQNDLMRAAQWNFTKKFGALSLLKAAPGTPENPTPPTGPWNSTYPPPPWLYSYAYPTGCLKMRAIVPIIQVAGGIPAGFEMDTMTGRACKYEVASDSDMYGNDINVVLCNMSQAVAAWTGEITNPSLWDANFQEAFVVALAGRLAMPLTGSVQVKQQLLQEAATYVTSARVNAANEGTTNVDHAPDWLRVRGWSGDWFGGVWAGGWDNPGWLGL